ncbi:MAG: hypothetical protein ACTSRP_26910 [Candidatus Helarchaeota archaeon]
MQELELFFLLFTISYFITFGSFFVELYLTYVLRKRYRQQRTTVLRYLFYTAFVFTILIILTNVVINLTVMQLQMTVGNELFILITSGLFKIIYSLGMIIICFGGIFIGLIILYPIEFTGTPLQMKPPLTYYPSNVIFIAIWTFELILEFTWFGIITSKKNKPQSLLKRKGFSYIWKGNIFGILAIIFSFIWRLIPGIVDPTMAELLYLIFYWSLTLISNIYYTVGLIMPEWVKKRVVGMSWIEMQGKRLS